jgi:hypothetical protein
LRPCRDFDPVNVLPQALRLNEVNAVLLPVRTALVWIEFEFHFYTKIIPVMEIGVNAYSSDRVPLDKPIGWCTLYLASAWKGQ